MEFNVQPYYDDFAENARDNNYLKILFKPGFSVQARELTQIQSILQNQIKALGDHLFQDGSPVIGGNLSLDNKVSYIKLDETYNNVDIEIDDFADKVILRDSDGVVQAKVVAVYYPTGGVPTLLIRYLSGEEFIDGDIFRIATTTTKAKLISSGATGSGTAVSINDGIFYVNGYFIKVLRQTIAVDAYGQSANVKVGLEISEDVVDHLVDSTLLDPAQNSFNYQAPGADRYQFTLNLTTRPLTSSVDESSFFELMRLESGAITKQVKYPIYAELEKTLARRTYDESGDYTVTPFRATAVASSDDNKYALAIEPGKAYVKGFEFETLGVVKIETDKPRSANDISSVVEGDIGAIYGNYVRVKRLFGSNTVNTFLDIQNLERVDLHCVPAESVNIGVVAGATANSILYANTKIGTGRVRNIKRYTANPEGSLDSNGVYNIYFTDVDINPRIFLANTDSSNANSIVLPVTAPITNGAYTNMTVSILPISLTPISNANVQVGNTTVTRGAGTGTSYRTTLAVGDIVRIGDDVKTVVTVAADSFKVNTAMSFTATSTGTNDVFILKQAAFSSNVTGQKRRIVDYDGSTRTIKLAKNFNEDARVSKNTVVQINCGMKDIESFVEGGFITTTAGVVNASANILSTFKDEDGDVKFAEADYRCLIYKMPKDHVKRGTLTGVSYTHNKYIDEVTGSVVSGFKEFTISPGSYLDVANEKIVWSPSDNNIQDNLICVIRNKGSSSYQNGQILHLTTANVSSVTNGIKITTDQGITSLSVYAIVNIENATSSIRFKTLKSNTNLSISPFNYPLDTDVGGLTVNIPSIGNIAKINVENGLIFIDEKMTDLSSKEPMSLWVPDVVRIRRVLKGNTTSYPTATNFTDITDHFRFDNGQRDNFYLHGRLILKAGYPSPSAKLLVHCDFYNHEYTSANAFFCVDSYPESDYTTGSIPVHVSERYGALNLRDCIDFRPTRTIGTYAYSLQTGKLPEPDSFIGMSFDYYLPRIDKLILTDTKEFKVIKGVSAAVPRPPDDQADSMTLYTIFMPPYVHDVSELRLRFTDHRRYTMRDIAEIDKRVERIEYYTSLNNIENRALDDQTLYADSTKKEKYGIVGEDFKNFNIADYKDPDFSVSTTPRGITAKTINRTFNLTPYEKTNTKGAFNAQMRTVMLDYTETSAISQPLSSGDVVSVQPFLFASFIGDVQLYPEADQWVSEELTPEIIQAPQKVIERTVTTVVREIKWKKKKKKKKKATTRRADATTTNAASQQANTGEDPPPALDFDYVKIDTESSNYLNRTTTEKSNDLATADVGDEIESGYTSVDGENIEKELTDSFAAGLVGTSTFLDIAEELVSGFVLPGLGGTASSYIGNYNIQPVNEEVVSKSSGYNDSSIARSGVNIKELDKLGKFK